MTFTSSWGPTHWMSICPAARSTRHDRLPGGQMARLWRSDLQTPARDNQTRYLRTIDELRLARDSAAVWSIALNVWKCAIADAPVSEMSIRAVLVRNLNQAMSRRACHKDAHEQDCKNSLQTPTALWEVSSRGGVVSCSTSVALNRI